ncbi:hypothetical protein GCM10007939_20270 [Amylibacter marinus]|uniref:Cobalt transporter subunit CbtB n=1 Tax=Amylibacter marinus TaxID=1475483 RepID=A0ABQ5VX09_9RHOB|nr:CbtB domain-containing protein [Amylibacter marinus]GLQ35744.1 hypothetical protein GCM10007939_20270 [Amylibacter marinus]
MTTVLAQINTKTATLLFTALLGLSVITFAGHIQAATLHDAAHDVRHATGFPCH